MDNIQRTIEVLLRKRERQEQALALTNKQLEAFYHLQRGQLNAFDWDDIETGHKAATSDNTPPKKTTSKGRKLPPV